jgi:hypothetical protein
MKQKILGMWNDFIIKPLDDYFSHNERIVIEDLTNKLRDANKQIEIKDSDLKHNGVLIQDLTEIIHGLQRDLMPFLEDSEEAKYWNNKYPKANIEYRGRAIGLAKERIPIDVKLLITPNDFTIHDLLKANNLYIEDGNYEEGIPKIYRWIKRNMYKYEFDQDVHGVIEFWEFPFEVIQRVKGKPEKGFDCDSWAHLMVSMYIAAGVPSWRVRVVVGDAFIGGHSTVYCYSDVDGKWHHLNSTYGNNQSLKISAYPTTEDAFVNDGAGIQRVWMSFNDKFAWHKFDGKFEQPLFKVL